MSNIQTFLNKILSARYGKDVRQSIHDAILEVDKVADTAQNSATRMANQASNHEAAAKAYMESAKASEASAKASAEQAMSGTPEGYEELKNQVGYLDIQTTTDRTLHNSKKGGAKVNHIIGNSEQDGTPTPDTPIAIENVGDCVEMIQGTYMQTHGGYATSNARVCSKNPIPCKEGDVIDIKFENAMVVHLRYYGNDGFIQSTGTSEDINTFNRTTPSGVTHFNIVTGFKDGREITPQTVGKITLTVNGKYVVPIKTHGKNFLNLNKAINGFVNSSLQQSTVTTYKISEIYPIGDYVVSWSNTSNSYLYLVYYDENKNIIKRTPILSTSKLSEKVDKTAGAYFSVCYANGGDTGTSFVYDIQIEKGTVATPYEPYTEHTEYIYLDEPLRETDRVVEVDGVFNEKHKRMTVMFDGSDDEGWTYAGGSSAPYRVVIANMDKKTSSILNMLCTHYKAVSTSDAWANYDYMVSGFSNGGVIESVVFRDVSVTSLAEFKAKLQANPITLEYELATPTFTPLDTESQKALNRLKTFDTVTYIEYDSKVKPSEHECEYGTSKVGAYTLQALNGNNVDKIEREEMKARLEVLAVALVSTGSAEVEPTETE